MKEHFLDTYNNLTQYLSDISYEMEVGGYNRTTDDLVSEMVAAYLSPHYDLSKSQYLCSIALFYSLADNVLQKSSRKFVDHYLVKQHPWDVTMEDVSGIMLIIQNLDVVIVPVKTSELKTTLDQVYGVVWADFILAAYVFNSTVRKTDTSKIFEWMQRMDRVTTIQPRECDNEKEVQILCGPSSSGKSTYMKDVFHDHYDVFSLDACRVQWYLDPAQPVNEQTYNTAFEASCADKQFQNKADALLYSMMCNLRDDPNQVVLVIDNMSLTSKSRRKVYEMAKRVGKISVSCNIFQTPLQTIIDRNSNRGDRGMNTGILINMYNSLTHPLIGSECDSIGGTIYYHVGS